MIGFYNGGENNNYYDTDIWYIIIIILDISLLYVGYKY